MTVEIALGPIEEVTRLYSYPNNFNEVGFMDQTLEETIGIYLKSTIIRDASNVIFKVYQDQEKVYVTFDGPDEESYANLLPAFVDAARRALEASINVNGEGKWEWNWRFFMPLGLAMKNHPTVQLLHFPPDYTLERDQDYLASATTKRWAELLVQNDVDANGTDTYQTTIDIVPIAAPSDAGGDIGKLPDNYTDYSLPMIDFLTLRSDGGRRPMVLFGSPVRQWIAEVTGQPKLQVGEARRLNIGGAEISVFAANHPSYFWNAIAYDPNHPEDVDTRHQIGMTVMLDDLIAACWQAMMAKDPDLDPVNVQRAAYNIWVGADRRQQICELTWIQGFGWTPEDALRSCSAMPEVDSKAVRESLEAIRSRIGPLECREPDRIPRPDGTLPPPGTMFVV